MMRMMIRSLISVGKRRLHTIVSREIIKPSSPTPSRLETYNLSLMDQACEHTYMPIVTFYPNTGMSLDLKKSLSQTLTKYYPFAGKLDKTSPAYVHCNDDGVEFLEASINTTLSDFLQNSQHEDLDEFFPHGSVWSKSIRRNHVADKLIPLEIQVNYFECGGVAVAASLSHKVADANSFTHFLTDWANMTRVCSTSNPEFLSFPDINLNLHGFSVERSNGCVTRSFTFPNSKINNLKLKVKAMTADSGNPITNLTRVEVLNWLLYKCAVAAAKKNNSGSFKPTGVHHPINIRRRMIEPLPTKSIGNLSMIMKILTKTESEMRPKSFISEVKKQKTQYQGLRNIETAFGVDRLRSKYSEAAVQEQQRKIDNCYICSSMCGYPIYDIDFGWGKPIKATVAGNVARNSFVLLDTPNEDGIEALVCLSKQDMAIFQSDPELVNFVT